MQAAMRLITEKEGTEYLPLDSIQPDTQIVKEHLQEKHQPRRMLCATAISDDEPQPEPQPVANL